MQRESTNNKRPRALCIGGNPATMRCQFHSCPNRYQYLLCSVSGCSCLQKHDLFQGCYASSISSQDKLENSHGLSSEQSLQLSFTIQQNNNLLQERQKKAVVKIRKKTLKDHQREELKSNVEAFYSVMYEQNKKPQNRQRLNCTIDYSRNDLTVNSFIQTRFMINDRKIPNSIRKHNLRQIQFSSVPSKKKQTRMIKVQQQLKSQVQKLERVSKPEKDGISLRLIQQYNWLKRDSLSISILSWRDESYEKNEKSSHILSQFTINSFSCQPQKGRLSLSKFIEKSQNPPLKGQQFRSYPFNSSLRRLQMVQRRQEKLQEYDFTCQYQKSAKLFCRNKKCIESFRMFICQDENCKCRLFHSGRNNCHYSSIDQLYYEYERQLNFSTEQQQNCSQPLKEVIINMLHILYYFKNLNCQDISKENLESFLDRKYLSFTGCQIKNKKVQKSKKIFKKQQECKIRALLEILHSIGKQIQKQKHDLIQQVNILISLEKEIMLIEGNLKKKIKVENFSNLIKIFSNIKKMKQSKHNNDRSGRNENISRLIEFINNFSNQIQCKLAINNNFDISIKDKKIQLEQVRVQQSYSEDKNNKNQNQQKALREQLYHQSIQQKRFLEPYQINQNVNQISSTRRSQKQTDELKHLELLTGKSETYQRQKTYLKKFELLNLTMKLIITQQRFLQIYSDHRKSSQRLFKVNEELLMEHLIIWTQNLQNQSKNFILMQCIRNLSQLKAFKYNYQKVQMFCIILSRIKQVLKLEIQINQLKSMKKQYGQSQRFSTVNQIFARNNQRTNKFDFKITDTFLKFQNLDINAIQVLQDQNDLLDDQEQKFIKLLIQFLSGFDSIVEKNQIIQQKNNMLFLNQLKANQVMNLFKILLLKHIDSFLPQLKIQQLKQLVTELCKQRISVSGFDSKVAQSRDERLIISSMLCNSQKKVVRYKLLYRASQYNFQNSKFWDQCDQKANTLTVAKTEYGKVIGGYTPLCWKKCKRGQYQQDSSMSSFLFSVSQNMKLSLKQGSQTTAIYHHPSCGPTFGTGHDLSFKNWIGQFNCFANIGHSYEHSKIKNNTKEAWYLFQGSVDSPDFKVKDWEVWQVVFT